METKDLSYLGTRCEIENMNSIRFIQQAIDYEAKRQVGILEDGKEIDQETRLYDPDTGKQDRCALKKKPMIGYSLSDLPPLIIKQSWVDNIKRNYELPDDKKNRLRIWN